MKNEVELKGLYSNLSKCLSSLIETRFLMQDNADAFDSERKKKVDQLIDDTATAMKKLINNVNNQLGEDHRCEHREQLAQLVAWINNNLALEHKVGTDKVVELVKELLSNAYIKDVE